MLRRTKGAAPRPARCSGFPGILCATLALIKPSCKNGVEGTRLKYWLADGSELVVKGCEGKRALDP
jgi:hypothetical protein